MKTLFSTLALGMMLAVGTTTATAQNLSQNAKVDQNGMTDDLNATGIVGVSDWNSFNRLSRYMYELRGADAATSRGMINKLVATASLLDDQMPAWVNSEELREDVVDLYDDLAELRAEKNDDTFMENLEGIAEAFEDTREEVGEIFAEYIKVNRDAYEEYMEEIESDRSRRKNMKDATEEYNEEIKDLKKVTKGK